MEANKEASVNKLMPLHRLSQRINTLTRSFDKAVSSSLFEEQREELYKERDNIYDCVLGYMKRFNLDLYTVERAKEFGESLVSRIFGDIVVISTTGQYNIEGFILFVDSSNDKVLMYDDSFKTGIHFINNQKVQGFDGEIINLVYMLGKGTGFISEVLKVYVINNGKVYVGIERPYSETVCGWGVFDLDDCANFSTENKYIVIDGKVNIESKVKVSNGNKYKILDEDRYVWNDYTKTFEQIKGRETYGELLMSHLYSDLASPKGDWFVMPKIIDKKDVLSENW